MINNNQHIANYEFNEQENQIIQKLVDYMVKDGVLIILSGIVFAFYLFISWLSPESATETATSEIVNTLDYLLWLIVAINLAIVGFLIIKATYGFKMLIKTEGDDIKHLLSSIQSLANMLKYFFWIMFPSLILITFSLLLLVFYF